MHVIRQRQPIAIKTDVNGIVEMYLQLSATIMEMAGWIENSEVPNQVASEMSDRLQKLMIARDLVKRDD